MPNAIFVLKAPNADKATPINMLFNFDGVRLKYATGEKILPKNWSSTKQRAKNFKQSVELNNRLDIIETEIQNVYRRAKNDLSKVITPELLREELNNVLYKNRLSQKKLLVDWMKEEIELLKADRKPNSIKKYVTLVNHLINFSTEYNTKLFFESITFDFYDDFREYIQGELGLVNNTFGKLIRTLKTFLNIASEKGLNTTTHYRSKLFKATYEEVNHIYLDEQELKKVIDLELTNKPSLDRVRDLFIVGCYTGLRYSDFTTITKENFRPQKEIGYVIEKITIKTQEKVVIPVKPIVLDIWNKYSQNFPKEISNQKMNEYLKELGKLAQIDEMTTLNRGRGAEILSFVKPKYQFITSHTARRSFATNAFNSGIPSIRIMKITGHRTESAFMKYIKMKQLYNAIKIAEYPFFKN